MTSVWSISSRTDSNLSKNRSKTSKERTTSAKTSNPDATNERHEVLHRIDANIANLKHFRKEFYSFFELISNSFFFVSGMMMSALVPQGIRKFEQVAEVAKISKPHHRMARAMYQKYPNCEPLSKIVI